MGISCSVSAHDLEQELSNCSADLRDLSSHQYKLCANRALIVVRKEIPVDQLEPSTEGDNGNGMRTIEFSVPTPLSTEECKQLRNVRQHIVDIIEQVRDIQSLAEAEERHALSAKSAYILKQAHYILTRKYSSSDTDDDAAIF